MDDLRRFVLDRCCSEKSDATLSVYNVLPKQSSAQIPHLIQLL